MHASLLKHSNISVCFPKLAVSRGYHEFSLSCKRPFVQVARNSGHSSQKDWPGASVKVPSAQVLQSFAPVREVYRPSGHGSGGVALPLHLLPFGHGATAEELMR